MTALESELSSAQKLYKAGALDEAFACCRNALKLEGGADNVNVHLTIAAILTAQEKPEQAEKAISKALSIDANNVAAYKGLAALLEAFGEERREELLPVYQKLVKLDGGTSAAKTADTSSKPAKAVDWGKKLAAVERALGGLKIDCDYGFGGGGGGGGGGKSGGDKKESKDPTAAEKAEAAARRAAKQEATAKATEEKAAAAKAKAAARKTTKGASGGETAATADAEGDEGAEGEAGGDDAEDGGGGGDTIAQQQAELAALRRKVATGEKLSGKMKRVLKKLEEAEVRWKAYEAASGDAGNDADGGKEGDEGEAGGDEATGFAASAATPDHAADAHLAAGESTGVPPDTCARDVPPSARLQHSSYLTDWLRASDTHTLLRGRRVLVVGGGQTSAHLALLALRRGASVMLARPPPRASECL